MITRLAPDGAPSTDAAPPRASDLAPQGAPGMDAAPPQFSDLARLLDDVDAALDREDAAAAEAAVAAALSLCAELAGARVPIDREALAQLSAQHARVEARALRARDALAARLEEAGRSRRATAAYGRR